MPNQTSIVRAWAIVTHGEHPEEVAELWKKEGVCAIGWGYLGSLKNYGSTSGAPSLNYWVKRFQSIKKDDIIFAYTGDNCIAYYGIVEDGEYKFDRNNIIGKEEEYDKPHQYKVKWFDDPHHFNRHNFPNFIKNRFGRPGTINPIRFTSYSKERFLKMIKYTAISNSGLSDLDEPIIKEGLKKYLRRNISNLERGMQIIHREKGIDKSNRPDFIAIDKNGKTVIIEIKGVATEQAVIQINRYSKIYGKKEKLKVIRSVIIAFKITPDCREEALKSNVELFETDLNFIKVT